MPRADALWYVANGRVELRPAEVAAPGPDHVLVRGLYSGISRGTERLVLAGAVPPSEYQRMRCPHQEGGFPFPVKYGYALIGQVESEGALQGRTVFVLHPHQSLARVSTQAAQPLPDGVPARRACLGANMETALNVIWDAGVKPGQKVLIIGGGVLGVLIASLAQRITNTAVTISDIQPARAATAAQFGVAFAAPADAPVDQDIVIHASATEEGLVRALDCAAFEGKVVEASWFGANKIALPLGGAFHSQRLQLISSQVGAVSPAYRSSWSHSRRLSHALALLRDDRFDALITQEIPFAEAPSRLPEVLRGDSSGFMSALRYA